MRMVSARQEVIVKGNLSKAGIVGNVVWGLYDVLY